MPPIKFDCIITCTDRAYLWLDGNPVPLDETQLAKPGQLTVNVGATMHVKAQIEGVRGSAWSLDITPVCADTQPTKLWHRSGTLPMGGVVLTGDAPIPANPCGSTDGLVLAKEVLPLNPSATKKVAKKTAAKKVAAKAPRKDK